MKNIIIAPVGDRMEDLFVGIREFPTERVILVADPSKIGEAEKSKQELDKFKIPTQIKKLNSEGHIWEKTFEAISEIKRIEKDNPLLINVSTGDRDTRCAATSAAFVNGIKAFAVDGNQAMLLPVLKFSYYKILTDKKLEILKVINENDCCASLEQLSKKTKMSLPLISYHINGALKSEGLKELGLVETVEKKGKVEITLSLMGRLLIKGYVSSDKSQS